jgi:hypothetical protein
MPDLTIKRIIRMNLIYAFCLMTTQFAASSGMSASPGRHATVRLLICSSMTMQQDA